MKVSVLTLFPGMFQGFLGESIFKRAIEQGRIEVQLINFRDYAADKHKTVDDYPFGGGAGMLLKPAPIIEAVDDLQGVDDIRDVDGERNRHPVVLLSPHGRKFTQEIAEEYAQLPRLTLICGHYEGFDERIRQSIVTDEVSIGDFVLTGGELAAMVVLDSVVRLLPGVLGNEDSARGDSFTNGLLEYPQYTRPAEYRGMSVPTTLLSGNHAQIEQWRHRHALYRTWVRRPDMLAKVSLSKDDLQRIERWNKGNFSDIDVLEPKLAADHAKEAGPRRTEIKGTE